MLFKPQNIIRLDSVESTNSFAHELLISHKVENGTVIVTRNQTKGRGQRGSVWQAEPGENLTFSVILLPEALHIDQQFLLNKAFCLAVHDFLIQNELKKVVVKWPNDVLSNKKKISGILIENAIRGEYIYSIIGGFGININQTNLGMSLQNSATSMRLEKAQMLNLEEMLSGVLSCIEVRYKQALNNEADLLEADYNNALFQMSEWCVYVANDKEFMGCIRGVDNGGKLIVEDSTGKKMLFANKEIRFKIF